MRPALRVLSPGLMTSIQDLGRPGYQHLGIPTGGALDPFALRAANLLVGNAPDAGALEIAYVGPTLQLDAEGARLACVGAQTSIEIFGGLSAPRSIGTMRSFGLHHGDVIRVGSLSGGAVLYLAIEGGFDIEPVLGSVSTYLRGGFGGWQGRALVHGDRLPLHRMAASERQECELRDVCLSLPRTIRAMAGPQAGHFSDSQISDFFAAEYTIASGSDRMGMRLCGRRLHCRNSCSIVSDATAPGSVQVTGAGEPIVLLADRQTTGGYPKIATVISADLPRLGRLPIGAKIKFSPIEAAAAQALRREYMDELQALPSRIAPVRSACFDQAPALLQQNLISGVIDAQRWTI